VPARDPIPRDLWLRLWQLDAEWDCSFTRCDARVYRDDGMLGSGLNFKRWWVVRIWRRAEPDKAVGACHPRLAEALAGALEVVEQMAGQQPATKSER